MKIKVGLLIAYNGSKYHGLQFNSTFPTIELEIMKSLLKIKAIKPENSEQPHKIGLGQTSRTDKGVHAAMCLLSCKVELKVDDSFFKDLKDDLQPKNIHLYKIIRLSARFNPQKKCTSRIYEYYLPTFVLNTDMSPTPISEGTRDLATKLFKKYEGTRLYHNFTSKNNDRGAQRYIKEIKVSDSIVIDSTEYIKVTLHGNSFLLHQIRKMVGYVVALVRFRSSDALEFFDTAFNKEDLSIPKAPSKFLLLNHQSFDYYNSNPQYEKIEVCDLERQYVMKALIEPEIFQGGHLELFRDWFDIFTKHAYNFGYLKLTDEV